MEEQFYQQSQRAGRHIIYDPKQDAIKIIPSEGENVLKIKNSKNEKTSVEA